MKFFYFGDFHLNTLNCKLSQGLLFIDEKQRSYAKLINHADAYNSGVGPLVKFYKAGVL